MNPYSTYDWETYIYESINLPIYYLYHRAIEYLSHTNTHIRVLDIGCGAGDTVVASLTKGWEVLAVDSSPLSEMVINNRSQFLPGKLSFQVTDFSSIAFTGHYQLIIAFFSLPFGKKELLNKLIHQFREHTQSGAILGINFFGSKHTWCKNKRAYHMSKAEILALISEYQFEIKFFNQRIYQQMNIHQENIRWDVIDLIAMRV